MGDEEQAGARVIVRGRVQGVFFRAKTKRTAVRLGLSGWVMNRADGALEAVFEGSRRAVEEAIEWCREGPAAAGVQSVEVTWQDPAGEGGFSVRYP